MTLTPTEYDKGYSQGAKDAAPTPRVLLLGNGVGVMVGGRFDGWLMRKHPDGHWVSETKLESEDPAANPLGRMMQSTLERK